MCHGNLDSLAIQAAVKGTEFYEGYTGVALPLQKLDLMAIPGRGGAVENWGLMQYDERRLLVNEVRLRHAVQSSVLLVVDSMAQRQP